MNSLREEILQAQRARSDLLKWKLGLVGVIGSVGLGLAGSRSSSHADLILAAVPPVCLYVDLLCRHLSLRMLVIATFFQRVEAEDHAEEALVEYERFAGQVRDDPKAFALESWAVAYSTGAVSAFVFAYGLAGVHHSVGVKIAFVLSGAIGGLFTLWAGRSYEQRRKALIPLAARTNAGTSGASP